VRFSKRSTIAPASPAARTTGPHSAKISAETAKADSWEFQNPQLNGYTAIMAYLPPGKIALALTVTRGKRAAATSTNFSAFLWKEIAEYLTPSNPVKLPGL
jgi:hypothetical protein